MRRRDLLGLVGGAMMPPPFAIAAQQSETAFAPGRAPRIGFIAPGSQDAAQGFLDAFREGLQALASETGGNPVIFDRWGEGQAERLPGIAKQFKAVRIAGRAAEIRTDHQPEKREYAWHHRASNAPRPCR